MQVAEAQDEVVKTNFNAHPNGKDISIEVNASSYKIKKPIYKKRSRQGGDKNKNKNKATADHSRAHEKKNEKGKPQL